jgi:hypothetical protein
VPSWESCGRVSPVTRPYMRSRTGARESFPNPHGLPDRSPASNLREGYRRSAVLERSRWNPIGGGDYHPAPWLADLQLPAVTG